MSPEMSFCMQLGEHERIGPEFCESLIGQECPMDFLGKKYPARIVGARKVDAHGREAVEVTVEFDGPSGLFDLPMMGLSNA